MYLVHTSKKSRHGRSLLKKTCMSGSSTTVTRAIEIEVVFIIYHTSYIRQEGLQLSHPQEVRLFCSPCIEVTTKQDLGIPALAF